MRYSPATLLGATALAGFVFMGWRTHAYLAMLHFWLASMVAGAWSFDVYRRLLALGYPREEYAILGAGIGGAAGLMLLAVGNFMWEESPRVSNLGDLLLILPAAILFAAFPSILGGLVGCALARAVAPGIKSIVHSMRRAAIWRRRRRR